jgi:hypothetical protein
MKSKQINNTIHRINKKLLERINKMDKPLVNLTKKRREKIQINKISDENGTITTNNNEIQVFLGNTLKSCTQMN